MSKRWTAGLAFSIIAVAPAALAVEAQLCALVEIHEVEALLGGEVTIALDGPDECIMVARSRQLSWFLSAPRGRKQASQWSPGPDATAVSRYAEEYAKKQEYLQRYPGLYTSEYSFNLMKAPLPGEYAMSVASAQRPRSTNLPRATKSATGNSVIATLTNDKGRKLTLLFVSDAVVTEPQMEAVRALATPLLAKF
jgi:predicted nucleotidyltransferase